MSCIAQVCSLFLSILSQVSSCLCFVDCDLVLSCLGIRGKMPSGTSFYIDTMRSITTAMRKTNVKRIIAMSSWGTYRK